MGCRTYYVNSDEKMVMSIVYTCYGGGKSIAIYSPEGSPFLERVANPSPHNSNRKQNKFLE